MNLNCSDFLILKCKDFFGRRTFILDTQADISVIKLNAVDSNSFINDLNSISIKGVTDGIVDSYGTIDTEIVINGRNLITHRFHVVPDGFNIPSDGIIGRDFIRQHSCKLDYETNELKFSYNGQKINLTIHDTLNDNTIVLPPRSEVFRYCSIPNFDEPKFILNHEIEEGIFIQNALRYISTKYFY